MRTSPWGAVVCPLPPPPSQPGSEMGFVSSTEVEPLPREEGSWMGMPVPLSADSPEFPCESFPTPSSKGDFFSPLKNFARQSYSLLFVKIEACHVLGPS